MKIINVYPCELKDEWLRGWDDFIFHYLRELRKIGYDTELVGLGKKNKIIFREFPIKRFKFFDFLRYINKNKDTALIHTHNLLPISFLFHYDMIHIHGEVKPRSYIRKKLLEKLLKKGEYVCCLYQKQKELIANEFGIDKERIFAIRNTIDMSLFKPSKKQKEYILFVGRLDAPKNVKTLVQFSNTYEIPLKIVGTGPQEKYLRSIAGKNVKFLGWLPKRKLPELYSMAKFTALPSFAEGFPLVLIESLACGTLFIACNDCRGAVEVFNETKKGLIVDRSFLWAKMREVFESDSYLKKLIYGCRKSVEKKFDYWESLKQIKEIYEMVVDTHKG